VCLYVWTASTSWFIPLGDRDDEADQTLDKIEKHLEIIENDLHQRRNSVTKCNDHFLSDKENHTSEHAMKRERLLKSISLQVTHVSKSYINNSTHFCTLCFLSKTVHVVLLAMFWIECFTKHQFFTQPLMLDENLVQMSLSWILTGCIIACQFTFVEYTDTDSFIQNRKAKVNTI